MIAIVLYPLIYVISASISNPTYVNSGEMWLLPKAITFEGYLKDFQDKDIWNGYKNTIIYTISGVLGHFFILLPCAYALLRNRIPYQIEIILFLLCRMFFYGVVIH